MGASFIKSEPEAKLSVEWQKAKPTLLFHESYSDESSEDRSTPSCRSLDGDPEVFVKNIQETPALQELEETVMQARAAEDYKQARKLKARRSSVTLVVSDVSDSPPIEPAMSSSRHRDNLSRADTYDVTGAETHSASADETSKKTKPDVKWSADTGRDSHGSVPSDDSSFGSLGSTESPKPTKDHPAPPKKRSTTGTKDRKSTKKSDKK